MGIEPALRARDTASSVVEAFHEFLIILIELSDF